MKKTIFIILVITALKAVGQEQDVINYKNDSEKLDEKEAKFKKLMDSLKVSNPKEYYRVMSKDAGNEGLTAFGVGVLCGGIVVLHEVSLKNPWLHEIMNEEQDGSGYLMLAIVSVVCIGGSFVCFFNCARYGGKAATLSIREQQVLVPQNNGFLIKSTPELCLRINF